MGSGASAAAEAKRIGNEAFQVKDFPRAVEAYSRAIEADGSDAKLYSNRAAAYMGDGRHGFAYYDAVKSAELDRCWPKAYFRMGQALLALGAKAQAAAALRVCAALLPGDAAAAQFLQETEAQISTRALRGYLLSWGSDENSCLGHAGSGARQRDSTAPRPVEALKAYRIADVACGIGHSVAVGVDGKVWAWGLNSYAQCADAGTGQASQAVPMPSLLASLLSVSVVAVACGAGHSIVLTSGGEAFAWGLGANGQLGQGASSLATLRAPARIESLRGTHLAGVACGFAHTMLVDSQGRLFACGWNSQGQVGISDPSSNITLPSGCAVPEIGLVPGFEKGGVEHVACGGVHTAVVQESGEGKALWCFGANACGQLGTGNLEDAGAPMLVSLSVDCAEKVALCSCGEEFSFGISEHRQVFAWGLNNVGQLGLPVAEQGDLRSSLNLVLQPTRVPDLSSVGIEWIVSGQGVAHGVTQEGCVWTWGAAEFGDPSSAQPPKKSGMLGQHEALTMAAGRRHFCSLCRAPSAEDAELRQKSAGGLRAGRKIDFEAVLYTPRGDVWKEHVTGQPVAAFVIDEETGRGNAEVEVNENMDGTFDVSFKPVDAGTFTMHFLLAGRHVRGSPAMLLVVAGAICPEKSFCTLRGLRRIRCGEVLSVFTVARDAQENCVFGGQQRASVTVDGDVPAESRVEDADNGQSHIHLRWDTVGERKVRAFLADGNLKPVELMTSTVEVVPAAPSPAHFQVENTVGTSAPLEAEVGQQFEFGLLLRDRFGNATDEMLTDLQVFAEGLQGHVPVCIRPPPQIEPDIVSKFGAWKPPEAHFCRVGLVAEVGISGDYTLVWESRLAGSSGRAELHVKSGLADCYQSIVTGAENRIFKASETDGTMALHFELVAHDKFGNCCNRHGEDKVSMRLKRWGCEGVSLTEASVLKLSEASSRFLAVGHADHFGEWQLEVFVNGSSLLGSPFVIHLAEDPAEVQRREEDARRQREELERQRRAKEEEERRAKEQRQEDLAAAVAAPISARRPEQSCEAQGPDEKELERRRKIYERLKREEEVHKRAQEALRKELEERRAKMRLEKEKKEKRCGGGFQVVFKGFAPDAQPGARGAGPRSSQNAWGSGEGAVQE